MTLHLLMRILEVAPHLKQKFNFFNHFIDCCGLIYLGCIGPHFTQTNGRDSQHIIRSRIDIAHATIGWISLFPNSKAYYLPRLSFDHTPILLKTKNLTSFGIRPFHFETMWMNHEDFPNLVKNTWDQEHLNLEETINSFKYNLNHWNTQTLKFIFKKKTKTPGQNSRNPK